MNAITERLDSLWATVRDPHNLTLVLESFTLIGLPIAFVLFVTTWACGESKAQKATLAVLALAALAPFAYPAPEAGALPGDAPWLFVALAAVTGLALLLGKGGKAGLWLTLLTLASCLVVTAYCLTLVLPPPAPATTPQAPAPTPGPAGLPDGPHGPAPPATPGTTPPGPTPGAP